MATEFTKYETRGAYHWNAMAEWLPNRYSARLHALYSWFVKEIRRREPVVVVDIGCGDAALTHLMSRATSGHVVGIEPEPAGIALASEALRAASSSAEVIQGRGEALPFAARTVDVVTLCEVVEHLNDPRPLLAEAARVLRPDGALLVSTPQWQQPELRPFHVREYRGVELRALIAECFDRVEVRVSEPGPVHERYRRSRSARIGINLVSQVGLNPFSVRRPATPGRASWRQLVATGESPRPPAV